jgi:hypothetical protein
MQHSSSSSAEIPSGRWSGVSPGGQELDLYGPYSIESREVWYVERLDGCISTIYTSDGVYTEELLYGDCSVSRGISIWTEASTLFLTADGVNLHAGFMGVLSREERGSWVGTAEPVMTHGFTQGMFSGLLALNVQVSFQGEQPTLYWPSGECRSRLEERTSGKGWAQYSETRLSGICMPSRNVRFIWLTDNRLLLSYDGLDGNYIGILSRG